MNAIAVPFLKAASPFFKLLLLHSLRFFADRLRLFYYFGRSGLRASQPFRQWILTHKLPAREFRYMIHTCLCERYHKLLDYDGRQLKFRCLSDDKNGLDTIWFLSRDFEKYISGQAISLQALEDDPEVILTAKDYLRTYWVLHAEDFIMDNLDKAHVTPARKVTIKSVAHS